MIDHQVNQANCLNYRNRNNINKEKYELWENRRVVQLYHLAIAAGKWWGRGGGQVGGEVNP